MSDPRDREFHDEELSALYRATRDLEPPAWLDQHVLKTAEAATRAPAIPAVPRSLWHGRSWRVPAALAATVVLAVGVVQLARETGEWHPTVESGELRSLAKPAVEANVADHLESRAADRAPASAASLRPVMPMGEAVRVAPLSAPPPPSAPSSAPPMGGMPRSLRFQAAPVEVEVELERQEKIFQAVPADRKSDERAGSPPNEPADRSPDAWLAAIVELRRQGRTAEAEASLAEFRRRYPDHRWEAMPAASP